MKILKNISTGLILAVTLTLSLLTLTMQTAYAAPIDENAMQLAQADIYFCRSGGISSDDYDADAIARIRAFCDTSNASELIADGDCLDPRELDSSKYYISDQFYQDLCVQASGYNEDGVNIRGGNAVLANQQLDENKERYGCYEYLNISIPRAAICSLNLAQIAELCRSGDILNPQYIRTAAICVDIGIDTPLDIEEEIQDLDGEEPVESCEDNDGEFVFFICAIIEGMSGAINTLDSYVRRALDVNQAYYESDGVRGAWSSMRNIAYILLIPVMLMMVIGTALGFSFVDAYTVKRAIPRMFAAVIFIALSYDICILLIEITTTIGKGVGGLIAAPFGGTGELVLSNIFAPTAEQGGAVLGVGVLGGIALVGLGAISLGILASYLFIGAIALIIIFAVLTLREMIILFLVILSPIAIIAWIFPGNDKPWKLWWSSFSKLLYLFPMIVGLLVIGRAFASILGGVGASGLEGIFLTFGKLIAYIGPFFFIPALFKFAGGVFGNLAGMANDRSKGVFDRQRKYRGEKRKDNYKNAREGNRFKNTPGLRRLNKGIGMSVAAKDAGLTGLTKGGVAAMYSKNVEQAAREAGEKNMNFTAFSGDDTILRASNSLDNEGVKNSLFNSGDERFVTAEKDSEGKILRNKDGTIKSGTVNATQARNQERSVALINQARRDMGQDTFARASLLAKAKAGTYYDDYVDMANEINEVYGDDHQGAGAMAMAMKSASFNAGRPDIGSVSAGATLSTLTSLREGTITEEAAQKKIVNNLIDSGAPSTIFHAQMKEGKVKDNIIPILQQRVQAAYDLPAEQGGGPNGDAYLKEVAMVENIHQGLKGTKPAMANLVGDEVMAWDVTKRTQDKDGNMVKGGVVTSQEERAAIQSYEVEMETHRQQVKAAEEFKPIYGADGVTVINNPPVVGPSPERKVNTLRSETYRVQNDSRYQNYSRQWQDSEAAYRQEQAAMQGTQRALEQAGTPVTPPLNQKFQ